MVDYIRKKERKICSEKDIHEKIDECFEHLRIEVKSKLHDNESLHRENEYLRKMLETDQ